MATHAIPTDGEQSRESDVSVLKAVYMTVHKCMGDHGHAVDETTVSGYEAPEYDSLATGAGLLPTWVTGELATQMREGGLFPMDLGKVFTGTFKEDNSGSSGATTAFVVDEIALYDAVEHLIETGQVERIKERANLYTDHENLDEIAAFEIAQKASGWMAERIIVTYSDKWQKGTVTHDDAGYDVWGEGGWGEDGKQVKRVTYYASQNTEKLEAHDVDYLWYQWDCDGHLIVGPDANEVNREARKAKLDYGHGTLIKRSVANVKAVKDSQIRDRTRYLWW